MSAIPFRAEPVRYIRAWLCYRLLLTLPVRWAGWLWPTILPHAGDWAYRYSQRGDTAHLQDCTP